MDHDTLAKLCAGNISFLFPFSLWLCRWRFDGVSMLHNHLLRRRACRLPAHDPAGDRQGLSLCGWAYAAFATGGGRIFDPDCLQKPPPARYWSGGAASHAIRAARPSLPARPCNKQSGAACYSPCAVWLDSNNCRMCPRQFFSRRPINAKARYRPVTSHQTDEIWTCKIPLPKIVKLPYRHAVIWVENQVLYFFDRARHNL